MKTILVPYVSEDRPFMCWPKRLLIITHLFHMVRIRIYINRKDQSYGMTVYMPAYMSPNRIIPVFQAVLMREKQSSFSCSGPKLPFLSCCVNEASLVLTCHTNMGWLSLGNTVGRVISTWQVYFVSWEQKLWSSVCTSLPAGQTVMSLFILYHASVV